MLFIHHSNSLTVLTELLLTQLQDSPTAVLQPEQILVQNPGMKRWLQQQISLSCGIAANLQFPLPSRFIWDIFMTQFEDIDNLSAFDGEVLRWHVMSVLQQHIDDTELSILKTYLAQDDNGLSRFQLAEKMAGLYDQYLVYRPEMIQGWEHSQPLTTENEAWQAYLWKLLRERCSTPHRAELIQKLVKQLSSNQADIQQLPNRLSIFAISAMSPLYLNVLAALGQHIEVHIYNLNPCEVYWGDIQSKKEQLRSGQDALPENELLASLGKQGRDYIDQFYDSSFEYMDTEQFKAIQPDSLLQRIQHDILHLATQPTEKLAADDSIQIVSCYSELRELQVLHDRLLDLLMLDENLQAHDIVVLCPDINSLAPYIEAVFGQQPHHKKLPFSISDQNVLSSTPLLQVILELIALPSSRCTANEILSWIELTAVQRAYDLNENAAETIRYWVAENHIHWGLDKKHKQQLGMNSGDINTWVHGINRLLTAYIMNDEVSVFAGRVAAQTIMSQAEYQDLGLLQKFLDDLASWKRRLSSAATLASWQLTINELIDTFFKLDDDEQWLIKPLRDEMSNWQLQAEQTGFDENLDVSIILQLLQQAMTNSPVHHHYLSGGINFCNLIPMRTLPFKVVCLLGMADAKFPRREIPMQLDLISCNPKKGDRSTREDDRYMFLQSILSAGEYLYISYVGQNKKDDSSIEPSVVVTELLDYIEQTTTIRLPVIKTALQVFSNKNFEQGSYAQNWRLTDSNKLPESFNQEIPSTGLQKSITLDELIKFYKNPASYFLQQQLNMSLYDNTENIQDDETFALDALQRYSLNNGIVNELFEHAQVQKIRYLNSGELAEKNAGLLQFEDQFTRVHTLYQRVSTHAEFSGYTYFDTRMSVDGIDLSGRVDSYSDKGLLQFSQSTLKGKLLFSYWIQHCFLCASESIQFCEFFHNDQNKNDKLSAFSVLPAEQAKQVLIQLIDGYKQGKKRTLAFYVDTSYEYEKIRNKKDEHQALARIQNLWKGDDFNPFYEAEDIYLQTSLKNSSYNAGNFPAEFFENCEKYMRPLMEKLEHR